MYEPEIGTWSNTGRPNIAHYEHTATRLQNGKVLVVGGVAAEAPLNTVEFYDPDTDTWSTTGSLNTARFLHTASLLQDGKVLVAGGTQDSLSLIGLGSAELFDPEKGTWSTTSSLNVARQTHTATLLPSGKVLIANGARRWGEDTNSAELYDPASAKWNRTGDLSTSSEGHTATLLHGGGILIAGGYDASFEGSDVLLYRAELYDPDNGAWRNTGALNIARSSHTATLLPNGKVLVAGGASSEANMAELFDPAATVTPRILSASVTGKTLLLRGENFEIFGSVILLNREQKTTLYDDSSPRTALIGKKAGKRIKPGDKLQVRNVDGTLSEEFTFTGS